MKDYGFIRVAAAVPVVKLADVKANTEEIVRLIGKAHSEGVSILTFPELCVTGYSCGDLFGQELLVEAAGKGVEEIARSTRGNAMTVIVGSPLRIKDRLYNCAVVIRNGEVKGVVPKVYLPTYNEFYESRWFASGEDFLSGAEAEVSPNFIFKVGKASFAVEVCEDVWSPLPPSSSHAHAGSELLFTP